MPKAAALQLRRLTRQEYANTVKSLLGVSVAVDNLLVDPKELGFEGFASNQVASVSLAEQWDSNAAHIANQVTKEAGKLLSCNPEADGACWVRFSSAFGARAYRRPLTNEEVERHSAFLQKTQGIEGVAAALNAYLAAILQSPSFLYRPESLVDDGDRPRRIDEWATASRLSYLLWQDMPDEKLFDAARNKQLRSSADIRKQVERMIADPKAAKTIRHFSEQWLEVESFLTLAKDAATYPDFNPDIGAMMHEELGRYVEEAMLGPSGGLTGLFEAKQTYVNDKLAKFYGWSPPGSGESFSRVTIPSNERQGILTLGGVMAVHGRPNQSSPIARGKFVRERILCQFLPSPPNDIDITPPIVRPGATTRERFTDHKADPRCAGCHALIDPVGFLFEHYDGVGRYRTKDQGIVVDASGELQSTEDLDGKYTDVLALTPKLSKSESVASCLSTQWFRFAFGRDVTEEDECTMAHLTESLRMSGGSVKEMLVALTLSPSFLTATTPDGVMP